MIEANVLNAGKAEGPLLSLDEPLSFWGGFDPKTGAIIDVHHPQHGAVLSGAVLLMRESRGSGSSPGTIAEAIRLGTSPAAIILVDPDVNLAIGAAVAAELYGKTCPIVLISAVDYDRVRNASHLSISEDGAISVP